MEIMRHIKAHFGFPGIAVSGFGTDEDIRNSREAGFAEHLVKPVCFETLRAVIERTLQ
jgi:CheY-like chemotaxis protein